MTTSRRSFLHLAASLAGLGLAAACGVRPGDLSLPPDLARLAPNRAPAAAPPARGDHELAYPLPIQPDTLDPANVVSVAAEVVARPLHDTLVEIGPDLEPRPALAERWTVSPNGLLYTFFLRPGVTFHDGTPLDAAAVAYTFRRLRGDERPRRRALADGVVDAVPGDDDVTVEVTLDRRRPDLLRQLAQVGAAIVSPAAHQKAGRDFGRQPVGSGPFRFVEWVRGQRIVLDRFDDGWRGPPALDRVVFSFASDAAARLRQLEAGQAELAGAISLERVDQLAASQTALAEAHESARSFGIALNTQVPPFTDRRVRRALNLAIDREALVRTVFRGLATPLPGPLSPRVRGAAPLAPYPYDPQQARALLADAGYRPGADLQLLASKGRYPGDAALAQEVQRQLQAVGFRTRLELVDTTPYIDALTRAPDETSLRLVLVSWLPPSGEARGALYSLFHSSQWMPRGQNASFFREPRLDELLERAERAAEPRERDRHLVEAQMLLQDEAPWIFLVSPHLIVARASRLHEPRVLPSEVVTVSEKTRLE